MHNRQSPTGYFLFSLDTELAWGFFDMDDTRRSKISYDGSKERYAIEQLLDIFDEYGVVTTWAVVGHLFYEYCEECDLCPIKDWHGKYVSYESIYRTNDPLWYGKDIIETLLGGRVGHEIAFHGYTHKVFDESELSEEDAGTEIYEWLRVAKRFNLVPQSVIFPRNKIGFLDMFKEAGFISFRGEQVRPAVFSVPLLGKLLSRIDFELQIFKPEVYGINIEPSGLVNLPASRRLLGMNPKLSSIIDTLHLSKFNKFGINRIIKGVEKAAREAKVIHIWSHPHEFQTEHDLEKLHHLLRYVSEQVALGRLQSIGMADLAAKAYQQRELERQEIFKKII
jgi:hypothetical protein